MTEIKRAENVSYNEATNSQFHTLIDNCDKIRRMQVKLELSLSNFEFRIRGKNIYTQTEGLLKNIKQLSDDITKLMDDIKKSMDGLNPNSAFYRYANSELSYFTEEWQNTFTPRLRDIYNEHKKLNTVIPDGTKTTQKLDSSQLMSICEASKQKAKFSNDLKPNDVQLVYSMITTLVKEESEKPEESIVAKYETKSLAALEESIKRNANLMLSLHRSIFEDRETVTNIRDTTKRALKHVQKSRKRVKRVRWMEQTRKTMMIGGGCCTVIVVIIILLVLNKIYNIFKF